LDNLQPSYSDLTFWTWPPSAIFGFHTLRDPIAFEHTNFGEKILIGGNDMHPKWNSKKRPLAAEFFFRFLGDAFTRLVTYVHMCRHA